MWLNSIGVLTKIILIDLSINFAMGCSVLLDARYSFAYVKC